MAYQQGWNVSGWQPGQLQEPPRGARDSSSWHRRSGELARNSASASPPEAVSDDSRVNQFLSRKLSLDRHSWAVADDVFWERYGPALQQTEACWHPLAALSLPAARSSLPPLDGADAGAAAPRLEPWMPTATAAGLPGASASASRPRLLFQYKPYSQQDPLHLTDAEVAAVLEAVFGRLDPASRASTPSAAAPVLATPVSSAQPVTSPQPDWEEGSGTGLSAAADVAGVILIKLVMDLYLKAGPRLAFPLVLFMLEKPLLVGDAAARARVFDLLLNLSVHGELLHCAPEDGVPEDDEAVAEAVAGLDAVGPSGEWRATVTSALRASMAAGINGYSAGGGGQNYSSAAPSDAGNGDEDWPPLPRRRPEGCHDGRDLPVQRLRQWLRLLLFRLMSTLSSVDGPAAGAWAAALSCLAALATYEGKVVRGFVEELPLAALAALLKEGRAQRWPDGLRCWLTTLAANLLYTSAAPSDAAAAAAAAVHAAASPGRLVPTWWGGSRLDPDRLRAFGGAAAAVECYREAPTTLARRAAFCVLLDYAVSCDAATAAPGGEVDGSWVPAVVAVSRRAHSSEVAALGAALLHMRAAEALHPLFAAATGGFSQRVAAAVCAQMAAVQAVTPTRITQAPPDFVAECLECFEDMAVGGAKVPPALQPSVELAIKAVGKEAVAGEADRERASWAALAESLIGSGWHGGRRDDAAAWLQRLLVAAAEHEVRACRSAGRQPGSLLPTLDSASLATAIAASPGVGAGFTHPQLLQPHDAPVTSQPELHHLLASALPAGATAAEAFIQAVAGLLGHLQFQYVSEGWDNAAGGFSREPAPWRTVNALPPLHAAAAASQLQPHVQPATAAGQVPHGRHDSFESMPGARPRSGLSMHAMLSSQEMGSEASGGLHAGDRLWSWVDAAHVALATLTAAVEWLRLVPLEAGRRAASLLAAEALIELLVVRHTGLEPAAPAAPPPARYAAAGNGVQGAAAHAAVASPVPPGTASQQAMMDSAPSTPVDAKRASGGGAAPVAGSAERLTSPLSRVLPVPRLAAAWRRLTGPHGTRQQRPSSAGSDDVPQPSPLSSGVPALAAAQFNPPSPLPSTRGTPPPASTPQQRHQPPPPPPPPPLQQQLLQQRAQLRPPGLGPSLLDFAAEVAARDQAEVAERAAAAATAAATAEARMSAVHSFLCGLSGANPAHLDLTPPALLRVLFEDLRMEPPGSGMGAAAAPAAVLTPFNVRYPVIVGGGAKADAAARAAAVQAGRSMWDVRAAVLALLLGRSCVGEAPGGSAAGAADGASAGGGQQVAGVALDGGFLALLLDDRDPRVRHFASVFALQRLLRQRPALHRRAVREVVERAQRTGDDRLLCSPQAQVRAMLELRAIAPDALA